MNNETFIWSTFDSRKEISELVSNDIQTLR